VKRIGIVPDLYAQPLIYGLKEKNDSTFQLISDSSAQHAIKLRQQELDGAFLSPIVYSKINSDCEIVPQLAAISEGESQSIVLFFKEGTNRILTLAADPAYSSEIVLANIILSEKYDTKPKLMLTDDPIEQALQKTDAYLAVGDTVFDEKYNPHRIDLVDEWKDITDLPYVHGLWAVRKDAFTAEDMSTLIERSKQGTTTLNLITSDDKLEYLIGFKYELDEQAITALNEFLRMAYYHSILSEIPEVKFISTNQ
jgi:chorismate dehydratase